MKSLRFLAVPTGAAEAAAETTSRYWLIWATPQIAVASKDIFGKNYTTGCKEMRDSGIWILNLSPAKFTQTTCMWFKGLNGAFMMYTRHKNRKHVSADE